MEPQIRFCTSADGTPSDIHVAVAVQRLDGCGSEDRDDQWREEEQQQRPEATPLLRVRLQALNKRAD